jgi:hypothetical protein
MTLRANNPGRDPAARRPNIGRRRLVAALTILSVCGGARAEELDSEELAKLAQNPVGNLVSVPFQNNANFNVGPGRSIQDILNIQPVVPFGVSEQWNVITRTIAPVVFSPSLGPSVGAVNGLGDVQLTAFLSPANPEHGSGGRAPSSRCQRIQIQPWATTI